MLPDRQIQRFVLKWTMQEFEHNSFFSQGSSKCPRCQIDCLPMLLSRQEFGYSVSLLELMNRCPNVGLLKFPSFSRQSVLSSSPSLPHCRGQCRFAMSPEPAELPVTPCTCSLKYIRDKFTAKLEGSAAKHEHKQRVHYK